MPDEFDAEMRVALDQLRSEDVRTQNEGVAALIAMGARPVPALLEMLEEEGANQAQIMYALSKIADPSAAAAFERGLTNADESVRAYAATGLARIGDPRALAACISTINDAADPLHLDMTPSVSALAEMGLKATAAMLDLLMSDDLMTRMHGQRALELSVALRHGFRPGAGFPTPEAEALAQAEWKSNGNYEYSSSTAARAEAVNRWRRWLEAQSA